jgi:hypothetical protein
VSALSFGAIVAVLRQAHWTRRGANAILALRCLDLSNLWEDFWESRRAG